MRIHARVVVMAMVVFRMTGVRLGFVVVFFLRLGMLVGVFQQIRNAGRTVDGFEVGVGREHGRAEEFLQAQAVDDQDVGRGQFPHVLRREGVVVWAAHAGGQHQLEGHALAALGHIAGDLVDGEGRAQHVQFRETSHSTHRECTAHSQPCILHDREISCKK